MTSTTPPVATDRDVRYLIELVNEARDYAREIGLSVGMVAVHGVSAGTLDHVAAHPYPFGAPRQISDKKEYRSLKIGDTYLFSPKDEA